MKQHEPKPWLQEFQQKRIDQALNRCSKILRKTNMRHRETGSVPFYKLADERCPDTLCPGFPTLAVKAMFEAPGHRDLCEGKPFSCECAAQRGYAQRGYASSLATEMPNFNPQMLTPMPGLNRNEPLLPDRTQCHDMIYTLVYMYHESSTHPYIKLHSKGHAQETQGHLAGSAQCRGECLPGAREGNTHQPISGLDPGTPGPLSHWHLHTPECHRGLGHMPRGLPAASLGQPKVNDIEHAGLPSLSDEEVVRLDVPVNEILAVHVLQL